MIHPTLHQLCVLVFFLLLTLTCGVLEGEFQLIGSSQPIVATVNDDILLPCRLEPAEDVVTIAFEWTRPDLKPRFVHVWRSGVNLLEMQHVSYEGRTSVSPDKLKLGDMALKLSNVKLSDEGKYRCYIPESEKESFVELVVGAVSTPAVAIEKNSTNSSGVVLQCESKGWYPEPEVLWLDAEGNLLSAGPTETVRGPDDLYTVSSRVTVEKRHSNNFTCRVQQKDINQTRETHIHVSEDSFMDSPRSSTSTIVGLIFGMIFIAAVIFVLWKLRQNKIRNKKQEDEETHKENFSSEHQPLMNEEEEETGRQREEETQKDQYRKERETNSVVVHRKPPVNVETRSQVVFEDIKKQKDEVQTGPETMKGLDDRENTKMNNKLLCEEAANRETQGEQPENNVDTTKREETTETTNTETEDQSQQQQQETGNKINSPCPSETGTQQTGGQTDKSPDSRDESTTTHTAGQGLTDGDGQQHVSTTGDANNDHDETDDKDEGFQSTSNETAGQDPGNGGRRQDETETKGGGETKTKDLSNNTNPQKTETQQTGGQTESPDSGDGHQSTSNETAGQDLKDGDGQQHVSTTGDAKNDHDETDDKDKGFQSTSNETAGQDLKDGDGQQHVSTTGDAKNDHDEIDGKDEGFQSTSNETAGQDLKDGDGQHVSTTGDAKNDHDETDDRDEGFQSTSNETAGQDPGNGGRRQDETETKGGGEKKTEDLSNNTNPQKTETQQTGGQTESPDSGDGHQSTSNETAGQDLKDGDGQQHVSTTGDAKNDHDETDGKDEGFQSTSNETAGQDPGNGGRRQDETETKGGGETKTEDLSYYTNPQKTETQQTGGQTESPDSGDGHQSTSNETAGQGLTDRDGQQPVTGNKTNPPCPPETETQRGQEKDKNVVQPKQTEQKTSGVNKTVSEAQTETHHRICTVS